ncbi:MAG: ribonuclease R family protein [Candidatus Acidiferrales bacterium]
MKRTPPQFSSEQPSRPPEVTPEAALEFLLHSGRALTIREIAGEMGLHHRGRRALAKLLGSLVRKSLVEKASGNRFRAARKGPAPATSTQSAPSGASGASPAQLTSSTRLSRDPNLITGRLVAHRDGYGFVVPDTKVPGLEGDLFIGRDRLADAMHGDRVQARLERRRPDGRAEGRILEVLERQHPTVVGLFRYDPRGNLVLPYDVRLLHEIFIPAGEELTPELREKLGLAVGARQPASRQVRLPELDGSVVNVEVTRYPRGGAPPVGRVVEILGKPGEIGVDVEIILRKHHIPHTFSPEVAREAQTVFPQVRANDLAGRRDFRNLPIVTIDGETARDFDDAVYVERRAGGFHLQVHIADVAHYVRRASELDREARLRGTSVYFPNRAVPMLPEELSNGICSLNPAVDRLVMSVLMEFDVAGQPVGAEFASGVICSAARMTYTAVNKVLEGDAGARKDFAALAGEFEKMRELALLLNARRMRRGSIDFDLPEPVIEFDALGHMVGIVRSERNIAHRIIEEFMLAANEAVARYLEKRGLGSLHRVHEKPDPKKVLEFEDLARAFGYSLGVPDLAERRIPVKHGQVRPAGRERHGRMRPMVLTLPASDDIAIRPEHYQRLAEKIAGRPEERILSYLMLRSLRQARYSADALGHFALAAEEYTHFTSPIRRYPDLIVHRVLKWALENPSPAPSGHAGAHENPAPAPGPYRRVELEAIAAESSEAERRADAAERELVDWKTAQFMESHLGEIYEALVISVQKFGFFVELMDIFVEGLVPVNRLEEIFAERFQYRERDHSLVAARGKKIFRLGDRLRVQAERIDPLRHRVEFAVV